MSVAEPDFLHPLPPLAYDFGKWKSPPLDGSLTVSELYDWHEEHNPDHPLFLYQHPAKLQKVQVPISEVVLASRRAARYVASLANINFSDHPKPLIAILAWSGKLISYVSRVLLLILQNRYNFILRHRARTTPGRDPILPNFTKRICCCY